MLVMNSQIIKGSNFSGWLYRLARCSLALVFFWAGALKLVDPQAFAVIIRDFGIVPAWVALPIAVVLPSVEVIVSVGLLLDVRGSLTVITAMLMLFMAILGYGAWLGMDIDCGCFGPGDPETRAYNSLYSALYRDMIMVCGIGYLYWWRYRNSAVHQLRSLKRSR